MRAARLSREAADAADVEGKAWFRGVTLFGASERLLGLGECEAAHQFFTEGLELLSATRDLVNLPIALAAAPRSRRSSAIPCGRAPVGAAEADPERAPRPTTTATLTEYEPYLEPVRGPAFDTARSQGQPLSLDQAVAYALVDAD